MDSMLKSKGIEWLNGFFKKILVHAVYKRLTSASRTHKAQSDDVGKDILCKLKLKESKSTIHITNKIDFKSKIITRYKESHYIRIKESIHQKDIIIVNIYVPTIRAHKYIRQTLTDLQEVIDTIIVGDFNTSLSAMDISSRQNQ